MIMFVFGFLLVAAALGLLGTIATNDKHERLVLAGITVLAGVGLVIMGVSNG